MRGRAVAALAVGLVLTGIALVATLAHSPLTVVGSNRIPATNYVELNTKHRLTSCQPSGTIPKGTSAVRIGMEGVFFAPAVTVKVFMGSRLLTEGRLNAGGTSAPTVTVHVKRLDRAVSGARVCLAVGPALESIRYYGVPSHSSGPGSSELQQATLHVQYMRPSTKSWWSFVSPIAYHLGLGRAPSGTWVAFLALLLALVVVVVASRLTLEELG
jgi:hypothetical protein